MIERRVAVGVLIALIVQTASGLLWAGAAAQRITALELQVHDAKPVAERLARLEAELEAVRAQLHRIETKVDRL